MKGLKLSELAARVPEVPVRRWSCVGDWPAPCCDDADVIGPADRSARGVTVWNGDPLCCTGCGAVYRVDVVDSGGWFGVRTGEALRPSALAALRRIQGWPRASWWAPVCEPEGRS